MYNAAEIKEMMNNQAEAVCRELLPAGKRIKNDWVVGDIENKEGQSLKIGVAGPHLGIFIDFGANAPEPSKGDLLTLWMAVRNLDFKQAREKILRFLNVREPVLRRIKASDALGSAKKPAPQDHKLKSLAMEYVALKKDGRVYKYLHGKRCLSEDALTRYRIGESKSGNSYVLPYYDADDQLVMLKFIALERNERGKKKVRTLPAGAPKILFGIHAITKEFVELVITEGELDAMSMWDYGHPAVSVPYGAGTGSDIETIARAHGEWIQNTHDWLERFVRIWLGLDMDEPGRTAIPAIAPRLDQTRCRVLEYPAGYNDANECLQADVGPDVIFEALAAAKHMDPDLLKRVTDFRQEVFLAYWPQDGKEPGEEFWWNFPFRFRPKEVTVWHGFTKDGKTQVINALLSWLGHKYQKRSCVASMEINPAKTIQNMGRQVTGKQKPHDEKEFNSMIEWLHQWIFFYSHVGTAPVKDILTIFKYAAQKYGVSHFVVDSLMKTDVKETDDDEIKLFMNKLSKFANDFNAHVHLVAHDKKPDARHPSTKYFSDKYGVRGSAHIVDLPDNVICVWRNRLKEKEIRDIVDEDEREMKVQELAGEKDTLLVVQAQRMTGEEPIKDLWIDKVSWQFRPEPEMERTCYLAREEAEE